MAKLLEGAELEQRARELGVDMTGELITQSAMGRHKVAAFELQRRVIEAERHLRESRTWMLALISALASVASAVAAWIAVAHR